MSEILPVCGEKGLSLKITTKIINEFGCGDTKAYLGMEILDMD